MSVSKYFPTLLIFLSLLVYTYLAQNTCSFAYLSDWSGPSACSANCGSCGQQTYKRSCITNGTGCTCGGNLTRSTYCNLTPCPYPASSCCAPFKAKAVSGKIICGPQAIQSQCPPTTTTNLNGIDFTSVWTKFRGYCYMPMVSNTSAFQLTYAQVTSACANYNATVVSIHDPDENQFVYDLASNASPKATNIFIGLKLARNSGAAYAPATGMSWSDSTPVYYGSKYGSAPGVGTVPWAPASIYQAQPDNIPAPGDCTVMWLKGFGYTPAQWDDIACNGFYSYGVVCKKDMA